MSLFESVKIYASSWNVVNQRPLAAEEIAAVERTEVTSSQFGLSVCFHMKSGGRAYIPLTQDATATVGSAIDLSKAQVVELSKSGEENITRISI
jgi:hypothetical protein